MAKKTAHNYGSVEEVLAHPAIAFLFGDPTTNLTRAAAHYKPPAPDQRQSSFTPELSRMLTYLEDEGFELPPHVVALRVRRRTKAEIEADEARKSGRIGSRQVRTYPVYGRVQAGMFNGFDQIGQDGEIEDYYYSATELEEGDRGEPFVLEIRGESMTDGSESVDFPDGSRALINPNVAPMPGDFVVVFDSRDSTTTFKKFILQGGEEWLIPLNPAFSPFPRDIEHHQYAGVVEEAMKPLYSRQLGIKRRR